MGDEPGTWTLNQESEHLRFVLDVNLRFDATL